MFRRFVPQPAGRSTEPMCARLVDLRALCSHRPILRGCDVPSTAARTSQGPVFLANHLSPHSMLEIVSFTRFEKAPSIHLLTISHQPKALL